jgi:hypothetical protein
MGMIRNKNVGVAEFVDVRKLFENEPGDFTPWLEENIEALNARLGRLTLSVEEREKPIGVFKADLVCTDSSGGTVIIENQLEKTDHHHLGQILVYLINHGAKTAIWISSDPRSEHIEVVKWLNTITDKDMSFYLIKLEAVRLGDSDETSDSYYAPIFTPIVWPDEGLKEYGSAVKELAKRHHARLDFWTQFVAKLKERSIKPFSNRKPGKDHWITIGAGKQGVHIGCNIYKQGTSVDLYIDYDRKSGKMNKQFFDELKIDQKEIEDEVHAVLEWDRGESKRSSTITLRIEKEKGLYDKESWPEMIDELIDNMVRFHGQL